MISGLGPMHNFATYLTRYTKEKVVIGVGGGSYSVEHIFKASEAEGLQGGILEAFGKLFAKGVQMYVFPYISEDGVLSDCTRPKSDNETTRTLLTHLCATEKIVPIEDKYIPSVVLDPKTN